MNKVVTSGKRYLKNDRWHDDNGLLPGRPGQWDPPMTDEEAYMAALSDPDAQPSTPEQLERMRRIPFVKHVRWFLGLSQKEFAQHFGIPQALLDQWERGQAEPDATAAAYLAVIKAEPEVVARVLSTSIVSRAAEL